MSFVGMAGSAACCFVILTADSDTSDAPDMKLMKKEGTLMLFLRVILGILPVFAVMVFGLVFIAWAFLVLLPAMWAGYALAPVSFVVLCFVILAFILKGTSKPEEKEGGEKYIDLWMYYLWNEQSQLRTLGNCLMVMVASIQALGVLWWCVYRVSYSHAWNAYWDSWSLPPLAFFFPENFTFDIPRIIFVAFDISPVIR